MRHSSSLWLLLLANSLPLFGVLFWGWDLATLLISYWLESLVVGFYNVARMMKIDPVGSTFYVPFFVFHFGIFMLVHLAFIFALFGFRIHFFDVRPFVLFVALLVSHGYSYGVNFIGRMEYSGRTIKQQLFAPYGRIVVMHLVVLSGGWLVVLFGEPVGVLVVMVVVKTIVDAVAHVRSHTGVRRAHAPVRAT